MPVARRIGEHCPDDGRNDLMHVDQGKLRLSHEKKGSGNEASYFSHGPREAVFLSVGTKKFGVC